MAEHVVLTAPLGDNTVQIETGKIAKQASGSVVVRVGDSMMLVTAVTGQHRDDARFFPLVVDYVEKRYAAGRIPGGFLKREGRLGDHEVLTSRLTDRPIRPLFPDGYKGDTQITATVLSYDGENQMDVNCITGASTALMLSPAPFFGPVAGVRVCRIDGKLCANPKKDDAERADINIIMACSADAITMVEGEANGVSEAEMLEALDFGFNAVQPLIELQVELAARVGKEKIEWEKPAADKKLVAAVKKHAAAPLSDALQIKDKLRRYKTTDAIKKDTKAALAEKFEDREAEISEAFDELKSSIVRNWILKDRRRQDGRSMREIRNIDCEIGILPRVHGSALFTRGETQALVALTLGTGRDAKMIEDLDGKRDDNFMLHYNFPPFSVGEIKMLRGPGRREIGHGFLARKGLEPILPSQEDFPYVIRLVSEVLESNGSSSMATVCGGSMALMDAGVPVPEPVAGIAMGLIKEGDDYAILSDILGDEDHLGDMDFKVTGTSKGITALQMDIKIKGLSQEIMREAMEQARDGRIHILGEMAKAVTESRSELKEWSPRITTIKISPDRIRDIIGSGGKTIRSICERSGADVNVADDGTVTIASTTEQGAKDAIEMIDALTAEPVVGEIYLGTVAKVTDFGAFVTILPNVDGLCHISELSEGRVEKVEDVVKEGEEIVVKCLGVERGGKIRLSRKEALGKKPTVIANKLSI